MAGRLIESTMIIETTPESFGCPSHPGQDLTAQVADAVQATPMPLYRFGFQSRRRRAETMAPRHFKVVVRCPERGGDARQSEGSSPPDSDGHDVVCEGQWWVSVTDG